MITEKDLQDAIAECQGERHPNASTCIKLAALFTIYDHLYPKQAELPIEELPRYSYQSIDEETVGDYGNSEFLKLIVGRKAEDVWMIVDELMTTLSVLNPKLYSSVMYKIGE